MPDLRLPLRYRLLVRLAALLAPRGLRAEWLARREREMFNWWAFLVERGRLSRDTEAELVRNCWSLFPDAAGYRFRDGISPTFLRVVRSPFLCLGVPLAVILATLAFTGGLSATRRAFRVLPYHDPEGVLVLARNGTWPPDRWPMPPEDLADWKKQAASLDDLATFYWPAGTPPVPEAWVSPNFFAVLGVPPHLGRFGAPGAVLGYDAWQKEFHGDRAVVGRRVPLNGRTIEIVGVLPPGFWFIKPEVQAWIALDAAAVPWTTGAVARAKPGATARQLETELRAINNARYGRIHRPRAFVSPLAGRVRDTVSPLWAGSGIFLLVAVVLGAVAGRRGWRYGGFLFLKSALLVAAVSLFFVEWTAARAITPLGWSSHNTDALGGMGWFFGNSLGLLWAAADQRRRCPVCLNRLATPTTFGSRSSWLLDPMGTELLCERGHGTLYVPETHASTQKLEAWTALDETWREIFK